MSSTSPKGLNASIWARPEGESSPDFARNWRVKEKDSTRGAPRGRGRARGRGGPRGRGFGNSPTRKGDGAPTSENGTVTQHSPHDGPSKSSTLDVPQDAKPTTTHATPSKSKPSPKRTSQQKASQKPPSLTVEPPIPEASTKGSTVPPPAIPSGPKPPSRQSSQQQMNQKAFSLNVEPSTPVNTNALLPPSPVNRTTNRRKRSQPHNRTSSASMTTKGHSSSENETAAPPATLLSQAALKELPPHLTATASPNTPSFDIRQNIDNLVERVRALAMENNRPSTPGSHIDWAGDDDDSLPDLDDWGVKSTQPVEAGATHADLDALSPIAEKPVAEIAACKTEAVGANQRQTAGNTVASTLESKPSSNKWGKDEARGERKRGRGRDRERATKDAGQRAPPLLSAAPEPQVPRSASQSSMINADELATDTKYGVSMTVHPSIPSKPMVKLTSTGSEPVSLSSSSTKSDVESWGSTAKINSPSVIEGKGKDPSLPSIESSADHELLEDAPTSVQEAAVHKNGDVNSPPTPAHIPHTQSLNDLYPTHARSHSIGHLPVPDSQQTRSSSTPRQRRGDRERSPQKHLSFQHHDRTHSSPLPGIRTRAPQATRPIISVGALQQITKSLGAKREVATVEGAVK